MTTATTKRYYVCDKCGNPIEQLSMFKLEWKHSTCENKSFQCHIVHVGCGYNEATNHGVILCERSFDELNTKPKLMAFIEVLSKLTLSEAKTFLSCIKRLLEGGDVKL